MLTFSPASTILATFYKFLLKQGNSKTMEIQCKQIRSAILAPFCKGKSGIFIHISNFEQFCLILKGTFIHLYKELKNTTCFSNARALEKSYLVKFWGKLNILLYRTQYLEPGRQ